MIRRTLVVLMLVTTPMCCLASGIHLGGGLGLGSSTVKDPDGDTASGTATSFSGLAIWELKTSDGSFNNWRLWSDLTYQSFSLDGSPTKIGQNVTSWNVDVIAQRCYRFGGSVIGWFGAGGGLELNHFTERSFDSNDGFALQAFPDRSATTAAAELQTGLQIGSGGWAYGVAGSYRYGLGDGVNGVAVTLFVAK